MKKSTLTLVILTVVSLALSVVFGVVALVVLLGAAKQKADSIDVSKFVNDVQCWVDDNIEGEGVDVGNLGGYSVDVSNDGNEVHVGLGGVHVESDDGQSIDVSLNGINIDN